MQPNFLKSLFDLCVCILAVSQWLGSVLIVSGILMDLFERKELKIPNLFIFMKPSSVLIMAQCGSSSIIKSSQCLGLYLQVYPCLLQNILDFFTKSVWFGNQNVSLLELTTTYQPNSTRLICFSLSTLSSTFYSDSTVLPL